MDKDLIKKLLTWAVVAIVAIVLVKVVFWVLSMPLWLFIVFGLSFGFLYAKSKQDSK